MTRISQAKRNRIKYCTGLTSDRPMVYVLRGENGDMLVDTGTKFCVHQIDLWIKLNKFKIKYLFLTHGHFDHTWNARFFKQKYGAKVIIHEKDKALLAEGEIRRLKAVGNTPKSAEKVADNVLNSNLAPYCGVDFALRDDDTDFLRKLGFDADIVMLPGHTAGSMGILQGRVLYCGDAIAAKKGDYFTTVFAEDVEAAIESEKKIFEINPLILAPGHGQLVINERAFNDNQRKTI